MSKEELEEIGFALVLLEEIAQRYDIPLYRERVKRIVGGIDDREIKSGMIGWGYGTISTGTLVERLENYITRMR